MKAKGTNSALSVNYTYTNDLLTGIRTPTAVYSLGYGAFGLQENIRVGSRTLATYSYTPETNYLSVLDYGNGDGVQYTYDSLGRTMAQTWEDNDTVTYAYDNSGGLASVFDSATGRTTKYYYDFTDRLMKYTVTGSNHAHSVEYKYDATNKLLELVETVNGTILTTSYTYDKDNRVTSVTTETKTAAATTTVTEEYTQKIGECLMKKILIYIAVICLAATLLSGCDFYKTNPADFAFTQSRENVEKVEICTNSEAYGWIEGRHVNSLETIAELPPEEIDEFWNSLLEISAVDIIRNTTGQMCGDLLFVISYTNGQKELISFYDIGVVNADGTFAGYRLLAVEDSRALAQLFAKYADPKLLGKLSMGFRSYY